MIEMVDLLLLITVLVFRLEALVCCTALVNVVVRCAVLSWRFDVHRRVHSDRVQLCCICCL